MITLYQLQRQFADGLHLKDDSIFNHIKQSSRLSAKEHLAIYQSSMFGALQKSMKEIYAVCHKLVGEDFFIAMINEYIEKNISQSPDIGDYGADFADFIMTFQPAKSLLYLPDVARFEWAWHKAYHARYTKGIDFEKLTACYQTSAEKIIFSLPPGSFLLFSPYPIHRIWEVNQDSYQNDPTISLKNNEKYYFFVWRKELEMRIDLLNEAEWKMLGFVQAGYHLGDIYKKVGEVLPEIHFEVMFPNMVMRGWLAGCEME